MLNNAWKGSGICIYPTCHSLKNKPKQFCQAIPAQTHVFFLKLEPTRCPVGYIAFEMRHCIFPRETYVTPTSLFTLGLYYWVTNYIYDLFFFLWHFNVIITFLLKHLEPWIQNMVQLIALQWHLGEIESNKLSVFFSFPVNNKWFLKGHYDIIEKLKTWVISLEYAAFHTWWFWYSCISNTVIWGGFNVERRVFPKGVCLKTKPCLAWGKVLSIAPVWPVWGVRRHGCEAWLPTFP